MTTNISVRCLCQDDEEVLSFLSFSLTPSNACVCLCLMYVSTYVSEETVSLQRLPNALLMFPHSVYKSFRTAKRNVDIYGIVLIPGAQFLPFTVVVFLFPHLLSCLFFGTKPQNITRHEFDLTQKHPSCSLSKSAAIYPTHTSHFHPEDLPFSELGFISFFCILVS